MAYDNFLVDKRVVERNIKKGLVDPELLKQHIEALPDRESNCVHVSLEGSAQAPEQESASYEDDANDDVDDDEDEDDDDDEDEDDDDDDDDDAEGSSDSAESDEG